MSTATTANTADTTDLPPLAARQRLEAALTELVDALAADPRLRPPPPLHPTLHHVWDFAARTRYMLSEVDNIAAGRALRYPEQIQVEGIVPGTPNPAKAREVMTDAKQRSMMINMLITDPTGMMLTMMGLGGADFGNEIKRKAVGVVAAVESLGRE